MFLLDTNLCRGPVAVAAPLMVSAAHMRSLAEESVQTNDTLHLVWKPRDRHCREYWLEQRFASHFEGVLAKVKSQWNWKCMAQGNVGSSSLLFRHIGYTSPWILVTSDNARWDNLKFLYSGPDEGTLYWNDGRQFTRRLLNAQSSERRWMCRQHQTILQAASLCDVTTSGLGQSTVIEQLDHVDYVQVALGATDLQSLLVLATVDYFLKRVINEE